MKFARSIYNTQMLRCSLHKIIMSAIIQLLKFLANKLEEER